MHGRVFRFTSISKKMKVSMSFKNDARRYVHHFENGFHSFGRCTFKLYLTSYNVRKLAFKFICSQKMNEWRRVLTSSGWKLDKTLFWLLYAFDYCNGKWNLVYCVGCLKYSGALESFAMKKAHKSTDLSLNIAELHSLIRKRWSAGNLSLLPYVYKKTYTQWQTPFQLLQYSG